MRGALPRDDTRRVGADDACAADGSPPAESGIGAIGSAARVGQFGGHFFLLMRHGSHVVFGRCAARCTTSPITTDLSADPAPSSGTANPARLDAEPTGKDGSHPVDVSRASPDFSGDNSSFPPASSMPSIDASSAGTPMSPALISKVPEKYSDAFEPLSWWLPRLWATLKPRRGRVLAHARRLGRQRGCGDALGRNERPSLVGTRNNAPKRPKTSPSTRRGTPSGGWDALEPALEFF